MKITFNHFKYFITLLNCCNTLFSHFKSSLVIHHSFTLSLHGQNLPFQQILPTLDFFYLPDCLHDNGTGPRTYHDHRFIFSFTF